MKKLLAILLCATLLLALAACADNGGYVNYGSSPTGSTAGGPTDPSDPSDPSTPSTPSNPTNPSQPTQEPTQGPTQEPTQEPPQEPTQAPEPELEPEPVPQPEVAEPFTNDTSYLNAPTGDVSIQPKYVRWEDGMLIATCFVCNGTDKTISNINVESLAFTGNTGALASGAFGVCTGLELGPMCYDEWTFRFSADCVSQYGADLSHLNTAWSLRYSS